MYKIQDNCHVYFRKTNAVVAALSIVSCVQSTAFSADDAGLDFDNSPLYEDIGMEVVYDPLEPFNRVMFGINSILDKCIAIPIAVVYKYCLPKCLQSGAENFISNLFSPLRLVNFVLQGDGEQAIKTVSRFVINILFGFFGIVDVADKMGIKKKNTDFGETLKKWGAKPGPFIVLPVFGSSSLRGGLGNVFSLKLEQISKILLVTNNKHLRARVYLVCYGTNLMTRRAQLLGAMKELESTSNDMYATTRGVVMQMEK